MNRVLIIEDETSAQNHLENLLDEVVGEYLVKERIGTVMHAIEWLKNNKQPDLIFMDIHLSDGLSFDILEEIEISCPIIFVTAYDQYAIKAFKTTGIDYLLKPITKDDLSQALDKYTRTKRVHSEEVFLKTMDAIDLMQNKQSSFKERFLLKTGNHMTPVKSEEIAYFYRADFVFAKTFDDVSYVLDYSLNQLQEILDNQMFIRLNRQFLVNVNSIKKLIPTKPGQLQIEVSPNYHEEIHLSQERSTRLRQMLDNTQ